MTALCAAACSACAGMGGIGGGPFPELAEYAGREIESVEIINPEPFAADSLETLIETRSTICSLIGLPFCIPGTDIGRQEQYLDMSTLASDVVRLAVFFRQNGYFGTQVRPGVEPVGGKVNVTFAIRRGEAVILDSLLIEGTEGILDSAEVAEAVPLEAGAIFDLADFAASADTLSDMLLSLGYANAEVLRNYGVDTIQDRATASLLAVPGAQVRVDSILVLGATNLGREGALRQVELRPGDFLRATRLVESQRNLYGLELVQFATVEVAPDSLQLTPENDSTATVVVRVVEAPVHVVEAAVGYGTIECFRAESSWRSRSFLGAARTLSLQGRVTKIGLGEPARWGSLESSLCDAYADDEFRDDLDYRFAADFTQPYFFDPRNQLAVGLVWERLSEPGLYQRKAVGGRVAWLRRLESTGDLITGAVNVERGRTTATPAIFCLALAVCEPTDIAQLARSRWRNAFVATASRDRTDNALDPTDGYVIRTSGAWASSALASDVTFLRLTGEGGIYRPVKPGWVTAAYLRLGSFLGTASITSETRRQDFLPLEERFFAGGATTVRGYDRNQLGPGVYIAADAVVDTLGNVTVPDSVPREFVPLGGTSIGVASAELRMPSPILSEYLRLAAFVDAGAVAADEFGSLNVGEWRVTPGLGLRLQTPVGPARLDIAYNPYDLATGPLFVTDQDSGALIRVDEAYTRPRDGFFSHFRIHVAVGQAF